MLALVLVAISVGLDNFGAATTLGLRGVDRTLRLQVAVIFGLFEAAMPLLGVVLGRTVAGDLGAAAGPIAGTLLALVGVYSIMSELVSGGTEHDPGRGLGRLVLIGALLSLDNLVIGFALSTLQVNLLIVSVTIAAVSVVLSLLGLEIGARLGRHLGRRTELVGGIVLVGVGVAIGTGIL